MNGEAPRAGRFDAIERHAWRCFEEAENPRDRLAALKLILELGKTARDPGERKEAADVGEIIADLKGLIERVELLAARRRGGGPEACA